MRVTIEIFRVAQYGLINQMFMSVIIDYFRIRVKQVATYVVKGGGREVTKTVTDSLEVAGAMGTAKVGNQMETTTALGKVKTCSKISQITRQTSRLSKAKGCTKGALKGAVVVESLVLVGSIGYSCYKYSNGDSTWEEHVESMVTSSAGAVGSVAGTAAGTFIGTLIFPGVGTFVGGWIGGMVGNYSGSKVGREIYSHM